MYIGIGFILLFLWLFFNQASTIKTFAAKIQQLEKDLEEKDEKIEELESALESKESEIDELKEQLEENEGELNELKEKLEEAGIDEDALDEAV